MLLKWFKTKGTFLSNQHQNDEVKSVPVPFCLITLIACKYMQWWQYKLYFMDGTELYGATQQAYANLQS